MLNTFIATGLTVLMLAPSISRAQSDGNSAQVGTSRVSGSATRSREASTLRSNMKGPAAVKKPSALKFQFLNQAYAYQHDIAEGERPVASNYTYLGVNYRFKPSQYLAVRVPFSYYVPKFEGDSRFEMEDVYLNYWHADLAEIGKSTNLSGMIRLYLPTGEDSRFVDKRNGAVRATLMTSTDFAKGWNLNYLAYGQYNNHTQETFQIGVRTFANIDRTFVQGATLGYDINEKWSASQLAGTTHNFAETGDRYGDTEHFLNLVSTVYYQVTPDVSASIAFHDDVEMGDDLRPFRLLMDEDITYIFSIAATL